MSKHWFPSKTEFQVPELGGLSLDNVADGTKVVAGRLYDPVAAKIAREGGHREEPLVQPIVHSTTYRIPNVNYYGKILKEGGYIYTRLGSPTCNAVEATVNQLEGGAGSLVFSSGMAAISSVLTTFLKKGDHVVACHPLYSGTQEVMLKFLRDKFNIDVTFVGYSIDEYRSAIRPNTKVLYGETPCNPFNSILDLEQLSKLGREGQGHGPIVTVVDSTFASPYLQKPIDFGIDVVIHSATKYLGGHTDLLAGIATTRTIEQWRELLVTRRAYGGTLSPYDANLLLRGLKTLHLRVERQSDNAQRLAEYLESRDDKIRTVFYPGLKSNPGHAIACRQMKKFGGMISFDMKGGLEAAKTVAESVRLISLAVSLGGVESLIEHPATMTHGPMIMADCDREEGNILPGLLRFSVGIEDADDLIKDLQQALDKVDDCTASNTERV